MTEPQTYCVQFFRETPEDLGITDLNILETQDVELAAQKALLGYANNPNIAPQQRPQLARVITHDMMAVVAAFKVSSARTIERV
jgi:hypothetical protein